MHTAFIRLAPLAAVFALFGCDTSTEEPEDDGIPSACSVPFEYQLLGAEDIANPGPAVRPNVYVEGVSAHLGEVFVDANGTTWNIDRFAVHMLGFSADPQDSEVLTDWTDPEFVPGVPPQPRFLPTEGADVQVFGSLHPNVVDGRPMLVVEGMCES